MKTHILYPCLSIVTPKTVHPITGEITYHGSQQYEDHYWRRACDNGRVWDLESHKGNGGNACSRCERIPRDDLPEHYAWGCDI